MPAAIRSATRGADGEVRPADTLNTTPASSFDLTVMDKISGEDVKRLIVSTQDYPSGAAARNQVSAPARAFAERLGATSTTPNTLDGARAFKATEMASILVLARPAGTDKYTTEEQLQRAATIASDPSAFLALCQELIQTASAQPVVIEPDAVDDALPDGVSDPSDEQRLKTSLFYGNRCEWGKAYQSWAPKAQRADGSSEVVQGKILELTPQCEAPRPHTTADEPGVEPVSVSQKAVNNAIRRRKRGRRGGPTIISYEALGAIGSTPQGAKALRNFVNAFAAGKLHDEIISFGADLDEVALWKDDACTAVRPIGMCDIFMRFAEGLVFGAVREKADKFFTSPLPEDEATQAAAVEVATETLELARVALTSAEGTGDADLVNVAQGRLVSAQADFDSAAAPVNVPLNFVFSKSGCAMVSFALKGRHQTHPTNLSLCGDVSNMYNDCDQPVDADGEPDPAGHGREKMFSWFRSRFPELIPSLRLVLGTPSLLRLSRADGAVPLPGTVINLDDLTDPSPHDPRLLRSCAGGVQGRALSTLGCVGVYHEYVCHPIQKTRPSALIVGLADDVTINDAPSTTCAAYAEKIDLQRKEIGLGENLAKAAAYSPQGNLDCVPAALPGSPHHRDKDGNLTGRLACFKMVGSYHGDDDACSTMTDVRLRKKLAPLDRMDRARETEYITNVGQLKHNVLRYAVAPITHFTAQTTEPSVARVPLHNASVRIRQSWELATGAASSPQLLRDQAWTQACLPSEGFGGCKQPRACYLSY